MHGFSKRFWVTALLALCVFSAQGFSYTRQFADRTNTIPLRWKNRSIVVAVSNSFLLGSSNVKTQGDVAEIIRRSLDRWESVAPLEFRIVNSDKESVSTARRRGDGVSLITNALTAENLELFTGNFYDSPARSRVFFDGRGFITEADIVLNPSRKFSDDGTLGTIDLESTITHEIGHLLGLDHSDLPGATMNANIGRNGFYGVTSFSARTLASDDVAGIRAIYGARADELNCCGLIEGKAIYSAAGSESLTRVWVQDPMTGAIEALVTTDARGAFRIGGLPVKDYRVFAQVEPSGAKFGVTGYSDLGTYTISKRRITNISAQILPRFSGVRNFWFGTGGTLSQLAIPLVSGERALILIGSKNLLNDFVIESESQFISLDPSTFSKLDYGDDIDVYGFEIGASDQATEGDYSLIVRDQSGQSFALIGAITLESASD